ncbi:MAG: DegT/DnrJ/EryC1/StrS family aminotransferase [Candidatus Aenigmarchaeota archaeon]|nr:DegT/DnrJ/EryC1/StrS family aminotransferase [Candidatus Aenigmarchaeota archaeon]
MIPQFELRRQYSSLKKELDDAVLSVMESGVFCLGDNVAKFEEEFARFVGAKHCVSVASGTDALILSLRASGVGSGDEVVTVANTASPTVMAVLAVSAVPVLVDCDEFYNIDVKKLENAITKKTKIIIPVHLYGQPCDMDRINTLAKKHGVKIVEDCAQAHGATYKGKHVGAANTGCFSFYPTKNLGAYGDGGAITTNDAAFAEKLKMLRAYGQKGTYDSKFFGYNSRLDEMQAAILRVKLKRLNGWVERRREIARLYNKNLQGVDVPREKEGGKHAYHLYVIAAKGRDALAEHLKKKGIGTKVHYPVPIHRQGAFSMIKGSYPRSEENATKILSLPMFPELTDEEVLRVCREVNAFVK